MSRLEKGFYWLFITVLLTLLLMHHPGGGTLLDTVVPDATPDVPGEERPSILNRIAKGVASWFIDQTIDEKPKERRMYALPEDDPGELVRSVGDDGLPVVNHAYGW